MYTFVLTVHSLFRWLVLAALLFALYRAYRGWLLNKVFTQFDNTVRHVTATIAQVQLVFGLWLYCISPLIRYFLDNYREAVHIRAVRFFGMEHSIMMLFAVTIMSIGSARAKRRNTSHDQFKTMAIWYTVALLIILLSIPWPFSPLASRPYIRL